MGLERTDLRHILADKLGSKDLYPVTFLVASTYAEQLADLKRLDAVLTSLHLVTLARSLKADSLILRMISASQAL